jgi:hypothetical protein
MARFDCISIVGLARAVSFNRLYPKCGSFGQLPSLATQRPHRLRPSAAGALRLQPSGLFATVNGLPPMMRHDGVVG